MLATRASIETQCDIGAFVRTPRERNAFTRRKPAAVLDTSRRHIFDKGKGRPKWADDNDMALLRKFGITLIDVAADE